MLFCGKTRRNDASSAAWMDTQILEGLSKEGPVGAHRERLLLLLALSYVLTPFSFDVVKISIILIVYE